MWLVTTQGFYSVVEHPTDPDMLVVRCRAKDDIESLRFQIPDLEPVYGQGTDYDWRAYVTRTQWLEAMLDLGDAIDYRNFKDAVKARQGKRRAGIYMRVWIALLELQPIRRTQSRPIARLFHG